MKTMHCILAAAALILFCGAGRTSDQSGAETSAAINLLNRFIAAVNTKDAVTIRAFLVASATADVDVDTRLQRIRDFAEQGAPFRLEGNPMVSGTAVSAVLVDRENTRLNIIFATSGGPEPKMKSMRAAPGGAAMRRPLGPWSSLHELTEAVTKQRGAPAASITVIRAGASSTAAVGRRSIDADTQVAEDDVWSIGSIGKPICTTIIGKLIESGKLRWDEPLRDALRGAPMRAEYAQVTIEQIMQHRGGIPQDLNFTAARVHEIIGDAATPTAMRARYAVDILKRPAIARPGERNAYSNAGYALLGVIAERTTGKAYERLVHDLVFTPLGLKHSYTGVDALPSSRPSGHMLRDGKLSPVNLIGPLEKLVAPAGGGMYMSTGDLAIFGASHLKGLRGEDGLLRAVTVAHLHKGIAEGEGSFEYGCGWGIESIPGVETFHGHNGSNGTFRAQLAIFPKLNVVAVAIVNCGGEAEPSPCLEAVVELARRYSDGHTGGG